MAFSWILKLAFKCVDHFAWPLLALGYPLCASVQAIEIDSHDETRELISYWILLSLIYLFEFAFTRLLQWFQLWPYIKLMIIFWLIIPDFGRASYVYNNLIRPCISMKQQSVLCRLNNYCRKFFVEKDNFLQHAERYIKENGTEALEKLIATKSTVNKPNAEATNAIRATDSKELQPTNGKGLQTEHKDIKDLEVIEKKEIPASKQDIPVMPNLMPSKNASSAMVETKGIAGKDTAGGELPQSSTSTHMEVQKEVFRVNYPSLICDIPVMPNLMPSKNASSAMVETKGIAGKDTAGGELPQSSTSTHMEVQKEDIHVMPNLMPSKNASSAMVETKGIAGKDTAGGELPRSSTSTHMEVQKEDIPVMPNLMPSKNASSAMVETKGIAAKGTAGGELPQSSTSTHMEVQKEWTCALCQVTTTCEENLNSHLSGRKHRAKCEALKANNQHTPQKPKINLTKEELKQMNIINKLNSNAENGESIVNNGLKGTVVIMDHKVQKPQKNLSEPVSTNSSKFKCEVCNLILLSEGAVASHLVGRKHLAKIRS